MSDKINVSVRFSNAFENRIAFEEWDFFSLWLNKYFKKISNGQIVEAALRYAYVIEDKDGDSYEFNQKSFSDMRLVFPYIACIEDSLKRGFLTKKMIIKSKNISTTAGINSKIRYYPPYIISIESSNEVRISIDLIKIIKNIKEEKNEYIVEC